MSENSSSANRQSLYSMHPSVAYAQAVIRNLAQKTGKSIEQWISLIEKSGPKDVKDRRDWLKAEFKLGGTTAWMIASRSIGEGSENTDEEAYLKAAVGYVEHMYSGAKAALRPIHDRLIELGRSLGKDVKVCPCKTIVPLYRNHVFAEVKPATRTRIDFGLCLKTVDKPLSARLIDTGGLAKGDRITHKFEITSPDDIDSEVRRWLQTAYDLDS